MTGTSEVSGGKKAADVFVRRERSGLASYTFASARSIHDSTRW